MVPFILDAHLDIAWNAISFDRDQLLSISELRSAEEGMRGKCRGRCTVSLPELRRANVGICLATILARSLPDQVQVNGPNVSTVGMRGHGDVILREDLDFANQTIASAAGQAQLIYYQLLQRQGQMTMIRTVQDLDRIYSDWQNSNNDDNQDRPIGIILSMEGADPMINPDHAHWWWEQGLRTACLAHYGQSAYAMGTGGDGPLTGKGRQLLKEFSNLGIILDLVHTADMAFAEALDIYDRPVFVSHGNCRSLVPHDRQISDEQIKLIMQRGGVLGIVLDCWMLSPNWQLDKSDRRLVSLETLANHIDYMCQLVGSANHVGIGSDLDGGFGTEQSPHDLDTIADLQQLDTILHSRGYSDNDIVAIFHGNWMRFFRETLPDGS